MNQLFEHAWKKNKKSRRMISCLFLWEKNFAPGVKTLNKIAGGFRRHRLLKRVKMRVVVFSLSQVVRECIIIHHSRPALHIFSPFDRYITSCQKKTRHLTLARARACEWAAHCPWNYASLSRHLTGRWVASQRPRMNDTHSTLASPVLMTKKK